MQNNATFLKNGKEFYRQPVSKFCRVMGYLSAFSTPNVKLGQEFKEGIAIQIYRYNIGKRSEFMSRKYFSKLKAKNKEFNNQYA